MLLLTDAVAAAPATASTWLPAVAKAAQPVAQGSTTEAPDPEGAAWLAYKYGTEVEVLGERTESSQTFAQPDGSFRTRQSVVPQRVHSANGWVPIDKNLTLTDGRLQPAATTLDMSFSPGGEGPMLTFGRDGKRVSLTWPKKLPVPVVEGPSATYREVFPGVDLRLTANADSFSQVLIVKDSDAADNSDLAQLTFGLSAEGVTLRQDPDDGVIRAVDSGGTTTFISDGAAMWDTPAATAVPASKQARASATEVSGTRSADLQKIPVDLAGQTLTVTPSQQMLTSPATDFPLYIDPGFNGGKEIWTVVSRLHPDTSYWTNDNYRDTMRVGQNWQSSSSDDWRTLVQFNIEKLKSTQILSASVLTRVYHTADCSPSPFGLYRAKYIDKSKAVTWDNTKSTDSTQKWWSLRTVNATANKSACPKSNDEVEFGDPSSGTKKIRDAFQQAATDGYPTITLGFRAPDESDDYQWKKLEKDSTYLDINYNRKPGTPTGLSVTPCDKNPCANPAKSNAEKPQLKMTVSDPDGGSLTYKFEVWDNAKKVVKAKSDSAVTGVKSGTSKGWYIVDSNKKRLPDGTYQWRGQACDGSKFCGPFSSWYGLTIDTSNPGAPKIDIDPYKRWGGSEADAVPGGYGSPGTAGTMTLTPNKSTDGVSYYNWWFTTGDTKVHKVIPGSNGIGSTSVVPTREGPHTIRAYAVDAAGNKTEGEAEYPFKVAPAGGQWVWHMDQPQAGLAPSGPENNRPLKATAAGTRWTDRNDGYALGLDGTGAMTTDLPVLNTIAASGFTVAAWVKIDDDPGALPPSDEEGTTPLPEPSGSGPEDPADPPTPDSDPEPSVLDAPMTVLSQDGAHTSMFRLGYRPDLDLTGDGKPDPAWCFSLAATDATSSAVSRTCSTAYVHQGDWVHLVGVTDRVHGEIRLYVNGGPGLQFGETPEETGVMTRASATASWAAAGGFAVGRGKTETGSEFWHGEIDDVYAVPRVWLDAEIETNAARDTW
ncbi:LamG-like jellyroll fold domain-containing protein [Nucisporomicrobium flavum]|uniref:LamG-like jellyroll fold domain-containing protein n=1 Tax=Nucisporomicrobium flavum TaxID=2785915 RepID=UPI003C2BC0FC